VHNHIIEKDLFSNGKMLPSYGWLPPYSLVVKSEQKPPKFGGGESRRDVW